MENSKKTNKKNKSTNLENKTVKKYYAFIILFLIVIIIAIVFYISYQSSFVQSKNNNSNLANEVIFLNVEHLSSKDLKINTENGNSKINANINNSSETLLKNLKCKYIFLDNNDNIIYEAIIPIAKIKPNEQSTFSSIFNVDLSAVTHYTVSLID